MEETQRSVQTGATNQSKQQPKSKASARVFVARQAVLTPEMLQVMLVLVAKSLAYYMGFGWQS